MNSISNTITDDEIVSKFRSGFEIESLTSFVANAERVTKEKARLKVETALYNNHMKTNKKSPNDTAMSLRA